jgi:L-lactate utilization protein LutB
MGWLGCHRLNLDYMFVEAGATEQRQAILSCIRCSFCGFSLTICFLYDSAFNRIVLANAEGGARLAKN